MGSWFSSSPEAVGAAGMGADPRPVLVYSNAQFLDLVLIRSKQRVNGLGLDARLAAAIRAGSLGLQLPSETILPKWDRVGLLQLPSFLERHQYTADNIEVTEATFAGVQTRTLRQVCDSAMEVVVRPLKLGSQIQREAAEANAAAANAIAGEALEGGGGGGAANAASSSPSASAAAASASAAAAAAAAEGLDNENNERLDFLTKYYQFTGPVVNRQYGACMDKLEAMFRWVMSSLRRFELGSDESARMRRLLQRHEVDFDVPGAGEGAPKGRGVPFQALLGSFRDMAASASASLDAARDPAQVLGGPVYNTFSDAEIFELVSAFTPTGNSAANGNVDDGRVSLSNSGYISVDEFLVQWRASLDRTSVLRRVPREILSGAFVSQALQAMGLLPTSEQHYFLPMHFSMQEPPLEGWHAHGGGGGLQGEGGPAAAAAGAAAKGGIVSDKPTQKERALREVVRQEERERTAHLPQLGPPPPPAASAASSSSAASPASPHASIAVRVSNPSSSSSLPSQALEGLAILHIHAHGVARIGIEHQVLPPPPQREKEGEEGPR